MSLTQHLRAGLSIYRSFGADRTRRHLVPRGICSTQSAIAVGLLIVCSVGFSLAQVAKKRTVSKGPRALGLLRIDDNGHARLTPVAIMVNGTFYDASVYKADPVPMALQPGVVYEAVKTGVSQGLFTVGGAAEANDHWFADGKWVTAAQVEADKAKVAAARKAQPKESQRPDADAGGPPKLKRGSGSSAPNSTPSQTASAPQTTSGPTLNKPQSSSSASSPSAQDANSAMVDDPNRPVLRRQPVSERPREQTKATPEAELLKGPIHFIPAISDASGPEPRPYGYELKSDEEQSDLKKVLAMATDEVRARDQKISGSTGESAPTPRRKSVRTARQPEFHEVQMRAFDISSSNEAVLVLTASAKLPGKDTQYLIAVVAREDIYGELHKIFSETTDTQHLDVVPKFEFIDAVDADGDGRGELLFRKTWDSGSAFALYRVLGDRLWPLFEGKPGS